MLKHRKTNKPIIKSKYSQHTKSHRSTLNQTASHSLALHHQTSLLSHVSEQPPLEAGQPVLPGRAPKIEGHHEAHPRPAAEACRQQPQGHRRRIDAEWVAAQPGPVAVHFAPQKEAQDELRSEQDVRPGHALDRGRHGRQAASAGALRVWPEPAAEQLFAAAEQPPSAAAAALRSAAGAEWRCAATAGP